MRSALAAPLTVLLELDLPLNLLLVLAYVIIRATANRAL